MATVERIKQAIRAVVPHGLLDPIIRRFFRVRWVGDYATWAEAMRAADGYAEGAILERVVAAARRVRDGEAAYERDGVAFMQPAVNLPVLSGLQATVPAGGRLAVLDLGGSLGSVYWQHRNWLGTLSHVRWSVVEQEHFVRVGRAEFSNGHLRFYSSFENCLAHERPDVLLLSGVIPYLESPHELLATVVRHGFTHILIDRTGIIARAKDRLTVQHVPLNLYRASYPCWFLNRERLLAHFAPDYELLHEYINEDGAENGVVFKGFQFKRRALR